MTYQTVDNILVAFQKCRTYGSGLDAALDTLIADLGGWERFIKPGMKVLVKPNLLTDRKPDEAVTTHPAVLKAVVRRLQLCGADIIVGDSPASAVQLAQVWDTTGTRAVCEELGVPLISFEEGGSRKVTKNGFEFSVASAALDAELIVSLPKVKSHGLTTLTAAVKNLYGTLPGYQKAQRHKEYAHPRDFGQYIRALIEVLPPIFSIADGVVGMEGEGPSNGQPIELGFLTASASVVGMDLALCQALNIPLRRVPFLTEDVAEGTGAKLRILGTPIKELLIPKFKLPPPSPTRYLPKWAVKIASPFAWVRPKFNHRCIKCKRCVVACPMDALTLEKNNPWPRLDGSKCIGCCCCHEVCPENAITMRQSPLLRLAGAFEGL